VVARKKDGLPIGGVRQEVTTWLLPESVRGHLRSLATGDRVGTIPDSSTSTASFIAVT